jgi:hypothetical protein
MASSLNNSAWLEWMSHLMGGVSSRTYAAALPLNRFYCLLDELPAHLVPRTGMESIRRRDGENVSLFLSPACTFTAGESLPTDLSYLEPFVSGLALQGTAAWVRDAAGGGVWPFLLGTKFDLAVKSLNGETAAALPFDVRNRLLQAGILTSETRDARLLRERQRRVKQSAAVFQKKGYAPLAGLIHPFQIAALRRYYRYLIRTRAISLGDSQSPRRYVAHNESVVRFFHRQITDTLSEVVGEPLKPSYVYLASYLSGAELKKHTDREQCEFSVTLCLDFAPEPVRETPWPIQLDTPSGQVTVYQALGDGLAYRGTQLPHYRTVLPEGQTSTSIFFHYVRANFSGSLA